MKRLFALLSVAFVVQTAHYAEHVAQVIQIYLLDLRPPEAHGLLGSVFDFEWVHFVYNTGLELGLLLLWRGYRKASRQESLDRGGLRLLVGLVLFQGYHAVEHIIKLYQYLFDPYYQFGLRPPPGLLPQATGWPIFLVHFWLNTFVISLMGLTLWRLAPAGLVRATVASLRHVPPRVGLPKLLAGLAALAGMTFGAVWIYEQTHTLHVPGDFPTLQAAIDAAPRTATIIVGPGEYLGPFHIGTSLTLRAAQLGTVRLTAADDEPVVSIIGSHDVKLEGFVIEGGYFGVLVEESEAVTLAGNRIIGAWLAAIRLSRAQARIVNNDLSDTRSPYGKGIELANTHSRPASVIAYNTISGHAREGILLHNAEAEVIGNWVMGNNLRGIAITEMSMATVEGNTLIDNADAGLYVVDMSSVNASDNRITDTRPGPLGTAHAIRVEYYAEAILSGNSLEQGIAVLHNASVQDAALP